jgi:hypothetical protein
MPTDLTPAEKDDRQIERLIDKKPAPSRKPAGRGGPKHDNRRRRMQDSEDEKKTDEDLSRKTKASNLFLIAARVAAPPAEEDIHTTPQSAQAEGKALVQQIFKEIGDQSTDLAQQFKDFARKQYGPILFAKTPNKDKQAEVVKALRKRLDILHRLSKTVFKGSPADVAAKIAERWPNGKPNNWATRAGIIAAVQNSIKRLRVPASIKAFAIKDPNNARKDKALIQDVLKEAKSGKVSKEALEDRIELGALTAAYRVLLGNPDTVDAASLNREIDEITEQVYGEVQKLLSIPVFMKSWENAMKEFSHELPESPKETKSSEFYRDVLHSLDTFFDPLGKKDRQSLFDPDAFIDGLEDVLGNNFKEAPEELKKVVEGYRSAATSYGTLRNEAMRQRTATYHGVLQQGDPTNGPYTGYRSLDRRYFGKEHYDSIIKTAKQFLKEDWLKYNWEGGSKDAPFRAALDLSIQVADSNLYQAKIDVETYNMLLARLMKSKTDVFSETLITYDEKDSRRASAMSNQHIQARQALLRVASGLRKDNPRAALEIVKNLRTLVAQEQQEEQECDEQGAPAAGKPPAMQGQQQQQGQEECEEPMAPPKIMGQQQQGQQEQQGQQQQGQITDKDMDSFVEGKVDIKDLKGHLKNVVDAQSIEDFVDGLMEMDKLLKKTASMRVAQEQQQQQGQEQQQGQQQQGQEQQTGGMMDLAPLEDMDEAQVKAFLEKQKAEAQKLLGENDIEKFMDGLDHIFGEAENAAKSIKTGSVVISMSTLVRLAHANPEARPVLLGMIVQAAKKKKRKKDKAKKKDKGKKPNPFAKGGPMNKDKDKGGKAKGKGGKAPPFGGKKAPPFGKKKSSIDIDPSDTKW